MGRLARHFAKWIGWNFFVISLVFVFIPRLNLKIVRVIVLSFSNQLSGFNYYDLVLPFYMVFFFLTWWQWLRPRAIGKGK